MEAIVLDSQLTLANRVAAFSRSCFFYIRQLKSIKQSLTPEAVKTLVYAFISSRIDYCNSVCTSISGQLLQRLQAIQNATARLITVARRTRDTDTASVASITNTAAYFFQDGRVGVQVLAQYGSVLPVDILHPNVSTWRSVSTSLCGSVPRTTTNYGDRSFAVSGPVVWNSPPAALRLDMSVSVFRRRLKTFFITSYWQPVSVDMALLLHFLNLRLINGINNNNNHSVAR